MPAAVFGRNPVPRLEHTMNAALDLIFLPEHADKSQDVRADLVRATVEEQSIWGTYSTYFWQKLAAY